MRRLMFVAIVFVFCVMFTSLATPAVTKAQETIGPYDGNTCFASFSEAHWWGNRWYISHCDLESNGSPILETLRGVASEWHEIGWLTEPFEKYLEYLSSFDTGNGIQLDVSWATGIPIGVRSN